MYTFSQKQENSFNMDLKPCWKSSFLCDKKGKMHLYANDYRFRN